MTDRELMQWALEALEGYARNCRCEGGGAPCDAAEALRNRLEKWTVKDTAYRPGGLPQSEQELVAWARVNMNDHKEGDLGIGTTLDTSGATGFKLDASAPLVMHPHPAFQATQPQQHSEQWWRHEVSNAWAEGYEKGRVFCGCGDQIMPNDNAECGNCVTARNAAKPDLAQVGEVGIWGERQWQGLTDEEYRTLLQQADYDAAETGSVFQNLRHAIEAKLKEKNT